jgi:hypothetical protein
MADTDPQLNTRGVGSRNRGGTEDSQYPYAMPVIGPFSLTDVSSDNDTSSGGTPWVGRKGSVGGSINRARKIFGLNPDRPKDDPRPFFGTAMVNRTSESVRDRDPGNTLDDGVTKNKQAWWQHSNEGPLPKNIGNWTESGPVNPTLRLMTITWRRTSQGRRNLGMHTNIAWSPRNLPGRESMVARSQNRLTVARYRGQSFSSTTTVLGE